MHDLRWIRENPDEFNAGLVRRGLNPMAAELLDLDLRRRADQTALQEMQTLRRETSKRIGVLKKKGEDTADVMEQVAAIKDRMQELEEDERKSAETLERLVETIPNLPDADVPQGKDEAANEELRVVGDPPEFDFEAKDHVAIGEGLGAMDFDRAARMSGARFVVLTGQLARMERALAAFMLDLHTKEFGYTEVVPPVLVRDAALYGTGQLPKFGDDLFRTTADHWLIPTAEVPLTNMVADEILDEAALPLRFTALTPCFRSEAGAAGKDTRGMLRQHQFDKVEMVSIAHPDRSAEEHERMTGAAEEVLKRLGLAYRAMLLSTGDLGFAAKRTYDLEVWLPGQDTYREISSCSNCGDFQARRMKARFRPDGAKGTSFVHTLNGSGLAVGRTLIAVLENYQQADGSVVVPDALRSHMDGIEILSPGD